MSDERETETITEENTGSMPPEIANGEAPEQPELTLDDLYQEVVDEEAIKAAEKAMALPTATYTTEPPLVLSFFRNKETGRPFARLWGSVIGVDEEGKEIKGKTGYAVSWVPQNGTIFVDGESTGEDSGKPDSATKLYIMARKAFKSAYGSEAVNPGEVVTFLRDYAHRLRILNIDGRNIVVTLSAVRA